MSATQLGNVLAVAYSPVLCPDCGEEADVITDGVRAYAHNGTTEAFGGTRADGSTIVTARCPAALRVYRDDVCAGPLQVDLAEAGVWTSDPEQVALIRYAAPLDPA